MGIVQELSEKGSRRLHHATKGRHGTRTQYFGYVALTLKERMLFIMSGDCFIEVWGQVGGRIAKLVLLHMKWWSHYGQAPVELSGRFALHAIMCM